MAAGIATRNDEIYPQLFTTNEMTLNIQNTPKTFQLKQNVPDCKR